AAGRGGGGPFLSGRRRGARRGDGGGGAGGTGLRGGFSPSSRHRHRRRQHRVARGTGGASGIVSCRPWGREIIRVSGGALRVCRLGAPRDAVGGGTAGGGVHSR